MRTLITRTVHYFNPIRWTTHSNVDAISLSLNIWISSRGMISSDPDTSWTNWVYEAEDWEIEDIKKNKLDFWIDENWVYHTNKRDKDWNLTEDYE